MEKREYILREEALSHPFANGKYDHKNANIDFILGCESYKEWLENFQAFTEQDIAKPVFDKIRTEILEEIMSHSGTGEEVIQAYVDGLEKGLEIIDKYMSESENV